VGQAGSLDQVGVGRLDLIRSWCAPAAYPVLLAEALGEATPELSDLEGMGQPRVVEAELGARDDLGFAGKSAERARVEDAVAIAREITPDVARARRFSYLAGKREGVVRQSGSARRRE
jgi:hypothetical protein